MPKRGETGSVDTDQFVCVRLMPKIFRRRKRGGFDAEKEERQKWIKAERRKILQSVRATIRLRDTNSGNPQTVNDLYEWKACEYFPFHFLRLPQLTSSSDESDAAETSPEHCIMENAAEDKRAVEVGNQVQCLSMVSAGKGNRTDSENAELLTGDGDAAAILHFVGKAPNVNEASSEIKRKPLIEMLESGENELSSTEDSEAGKIPSREGEVCAEVGGTALDNDFASDAGPEGTGSDSKCARGSTIKFYCENLESLRKMGANADCSDGNSNEIESDVESLTEETTSLLGH